MGADAIAIGTAALIASACQQYKICNSGNCPVGCATQDEHLRKRVKIESAAKRVENFLKVSAEELKDFARLTGNSNIFFMKTSDLCTTNSEISSHTDIKHV
jgi:glutamate synthase domain-containing protein 2